jgi:hypothetical protein
MRSSKPSTVAVPADFDAIPLGGSRGLTKSAGRARFLTWKDRMRQAFDPTTRA